MDFYSPTSSATIIVSKMDLKSYKSGKFINQFGYRSFTPEELNRQWTIHEADLNILLEEANRKLVS